MSKKLENPQELPHMIGFKEYSLDKQSRVKIQGQSKEIASNVHFLHRKAKHCLKDLNQTQYNLMSLYSKRMSKLQEQQRKQQKRKMDSERLQQLKNITSLNRYLHTIRLEQNTKQLMGRNKNSANFIKTIHQTIETGLKNSKQTQLSNLRAKNRASSKVNQLRKQYSQQKSYIKKKRQYQSVTNTLRKKQTILTERQLGKIQDLSRKQQQLMKLVQKTRKQKDKIDTAMMKAKQMSYEEICQQMVLQMRPKKAKKRNLSRTYSDFSKQL